MGGTLVFAATFLWQLSNFGFNAIGAHTLGPAQYGILASAAGMLYLLSPLVTAVQTAASREATRITVSEDGSEIRGLVRYYMARIGVGACVIAVLVGLLSPVISSILHLGSPMLVVVFAIAIPITISSVLVRGVHQGTRRFGRYSLGTAAEGTAKLAFAVLWLGFLWRTPMAGMTAVAVSAFVGLAVNVLLLRHWPRPTRHVRPASPPLRYSTTTFAVFSLLAILLSVDTMAARRFLPPYVAGLYSGISLTGKIVFFATTALTAFLFPLFSARHDAGEDTLRWLKVSVLPVLAVSGALIVVYLAVPALVVDTLLGAKFRQHEGYLPWMAAVFTLYALAYLLVTYLLARRQSGVSVVLVAAVVCQLGGLGLFHRTIGDFLRDLAVAFAVALVGCLWLVAHSHERSAQELTPAPMSIELL